MLIKAVILAIFKFQEYSLDRQQLKGLTMRIFNKLFYKPRPTLKFAKDVGLGACKRDVDTRTVKQLTSNINYFAKKDGGIGWHMGDLRDMPVEAQKFASDICEMACHSHISPSNRNMLECDQFGLKILHNLIGSLPELAKENPAAIRFGQEIINNLKAGSANHVMTVFSDLFNVKAMAAHFDAAKGMIKHVAQDIFGENSGCSAFKQEDNFVKVMKALLSPNADPNKVALLPKAMELAENTPLDKVYINPVRLAHSRISAEKLSENLATFEQLQEPLSHRTDCVNLTKFLENNTNLD